MSLREKFLFLANFCLFSAFFLSCGKKDLPSLTAAETPTSAAMPSAVPFAQKEKQGEKKNQEKTPENTQNQDEKLAVGLNQLVGQVHGVSTSQLSFQVSGYVSRVFVQNGDFVKKGQPIAQLDDSIFSEKLKLAQYALDQANVDAQFARLNFQRTQKLSEKQATSQMMLEQAKEELDKAQISVKQAVSQLKLAEIDNKNTVLTAPYDGFVFALNVWTGNYVAATLPIVTLTSSENLQIQVSVPQTVQNRFRIGEEFPLSSPSQGIEGKFVVTGLVPYVDPTTRAYLMVGKPKDIKGVLMTGQLVLIQLAQ